MHWKLADELSVIDAAILILGVNPSDVHRDYPIGYTAIENAIKNALRSEKIKGRHVPVEAEEHGSTDVVRSTVEVPSLKEWLESRNMRPRFFFPEVTSSTDYLDRSHPRHAPKLAAAIEAWQAIEDEPNPRKRPPKERLSNWLRKNATKYGGLSKNAIEEIAVVANWDIKGGAPKQPTREDRGTKSGPSRAGIAKRKA